MSNLLGQLENNEAILLMYLAGELPEEDRAEVVQTLANDPALRGLLAELTALQADVDATFVACDAGASLLSRREAAVRRVSRALVAAQAKPEPRTTAADETTGPRFRIAWWAYPIAAAAAIVVGMVSSLGWILMSAQAFRDVYGLPAANALVPFSQPAIVTLPLGFVVLVVVSLLTRRQIDRGTGAP